MKLSKKILKEYEERFMNPTEKVIAEDDWIKVIQKDFPEQNISSYTYMECKKETVVCLFIDSITKKFVMRLEGALYNNFSPSPKIMTGTIEEGEPLEQALIREVKEEIGVSLNHNQFLYLGTINGTFQELHNYHIYFASAPYKNENFEGDGSRGEELSKNILMDHDELKMSKDFLTWIAYGMFKHLMKTKSIKKENNTVSVSINPEISSIER